MKKQKPYSEAALKKQILAHARALKVPQKWAEQIATQTTDHVTDWTKTRGTVTESDITRKAHQKLQTLHPDLAYIFKNRDKII